MIYTYCTNEVIVSYHKKLYMEIEASNPLTLKMLYDKLEN